MYTTGTSNAASSYPTACTVIETLALGGPHSHTYTVAEYMTMTIVAPAHHREARRPHAPGALAARALITTVPAAPTHTVTITGPETATNT